MSYHITSHHRVLGVFGRDFMCVYRITNFVLERETRKQIKITSRHKIREPPHIANKEFPTEVVYNCMLVGPTKNNAAFFVGAAEQKGKHSPSLGKSSKIPIRRTPPGLGSSVAREG